MLMGLSDAIAETEGNDGPQVHRSHWVARGQIVSARRDGNKAVVSMKNGEDVAASRTILPALYRAGILKGRARNG